jgi:hypothetical protein
VAIISGKVLKLTVWAEIPPGVQDEEAAAWGLSSISTLLGFANAVRSVDVTVVPAAELVAAQQAGKGSRIHQ